MHTAQVIEDNIKRLRQRIYDAAAASGRKTEDIKIVCVTKSFPPDVVTLALESGLDVFGENRVQELISKYDLVKPKEWHMIGHLQTNKVKYIVDKVSLIQSVDSIRLLEEIERQSEKRSVISNVLLQVNTSGEKSKFGVSPDGIWPLLEKAATLKHVKVRGLMTIAPLCDNEVAIRLHFANTHKLYLDIKEKKYDNVSMESLSMGMSGDFEAAILEGSNMVRIGTWIFGNRIYK